MSCLHTLSRSYFFLFPLKWENRFKANKIEQFVLSVLNTGHLPVQAPSPTTEYPLFSVSNNWTLLSRDVYDRARSLIIFISLCAALFDGPWQLSSPNLGIMCFSTVFSEVIFNVSSQSYLQTSLDSRNIISHHLFTSDELILSNCENLIIPLVRFKVQ